jgi:Protein of unknown function (DUF3011)
MNQNASRRQLLALLSLPALLLSLYSQPAFSANTVQCKSDGYKRNICNVDSTRQLKAQLVKQTSKAQCRRDNSWGETPTGVWVDQGCSGVFNLSEAGKGSQFDWPPKPQH